ncbi:MAG: UDP-N-acetylglucosamine--N-acetylmuramyl-(pentapeptide) pyrophosphoryl-undecaprenol N-acetylglucosamine transferase, partial [Burkholderiales bacterium PBB5]
SELCAAGVPSLLVPLVVRTTAHQRDNAEHLAGQGAAVHLPQGEFTPESLAARLQALDRPALLAMAQKARAMARPQAAQRVADELDRLVKHA